jgi:hypothetical protein
MTSYRAVAQNRLLIATALHRPDARGGLHWIPIMQIYLLLLLEENSFWWAQSSRGYRV